MFGRRERVVGVNRVHRWNEDTAAAVMGFAREVLAPVLMRAEIILREASACLWKQPVNSLVLDTLTFLRPLHTFIEKSR